MSSGDLLALVALALATTPAAMMALNLPVYRTPARRRTGPGAEAPTTPSVSVLIPARDEQRTIAAAVRSVLANRGPLLEVVVMDDHSRDRTAEIVTALAHRDPRLRLASAPPLPAGWNGKQHACAALAELARGEILVFMDADVELAADAVERIVACLESSGADLVSGFPRQRTGTLVEHLLIPLIHFVLLGFLPLAGLRRTRHPAFAAACGQLIAVRRAGYRRAGGHAAIRGSRHDGLQLPRRFRRAGLATDLFDATGLATCRMYDGGRAVWLGLAKNATEGMASPGAILPWSLLLVGGQVLPAALLVAGLGAALAGSAPTWLPVAAAATLLGYAARAALALRFHQAWQGVVLHPLGVLALVAVQWYALGRRLAARPVPWKGR